MIYSATVVVMTISNGTERWRGVNDDAENTGPMSAMIGTDEVGLAVV